jgi:hypothetical protein
MFRVPSTITIVICRVSVYTIVIDEKLGFFVAKIGMILMERRVSNRFSLDEKSKAPKYITNYACLQNAPLTQRSASFHQ